MILSFSEFSGGIACCRTSHPTAQASADTGVAGFGALGSPAGLSCRSRASVLSVEDLRLHLLRKSEFLDLGDSASYDAHDSFEQVFFRPVRSLCSARPSGSFVCTLEWQSRMDLRGTIPLEFKR